MILNSYFSGGGLFDTGLFQAGIEIAQSFELDAKACEVQRANLPHQVVQADISQKLVGDDAPCNVMAFTYPCTKYSTMADLHRTRTGDELFLHAFRHIALKKPDVYVVENVPGMRKFQIVMEAMTKLPDYYVQVICPVQASTWLPQDRPRLIIIGSKKRFSWRPPEPQKRIELKDILEKDPEYKITKAMVNRMNGVYRDKPIISDPTKGDIAPLCMAHYGKDKSTRMVVDKRSPIGVRPYTIREWMRLQGLPDWFKMDVPVTDAYKIVGNGVAVPVGRWVGEELKRYFKATSKSNRVVNQGQLFGVAA